MAMDIQYQAHVQDIGWQDEVQNGEEAGTTGRKLGLEAIKIKLNHAPPNVGVRYRAHVRDIGWQEWVENGQQAGTTGKDLSIEAIQIELFGGDPSDNLGVIYKPHLQELG